MVVVKIRLPNAVRKIRTEEHTTVGYRLCYSSLKKCLKEELGNQTDDEVTITYFDQFDGEDNINIRCLNDFVMAVEEVMENSDAGSHGKKVLILNAKKNVREERDISRGIGVLNSQGIESPELSHDRREKGGTNAEENVVSDHECEAAHLYPPAKKVKRDIHFNQLEKLCLSLSDQHQKKIGVPCAFKMKDSSDQMYLSCPFCDIDLKVPSDLILSQVQQKVVNHTERACHRANVYNCTSRA